MQKVDEKKVKEAIELIKQEIQTLEDLGEVVSIIEEKKKKHIELYNTVIEALEKQLPKQLPKRVDFEEDVAENMCVECPSCGSFLGYRVDCLDENYQFDNCKHCGQRLDWSET